MLLVLSSSELQSRTKETAASLQAENRRHVHQRNSGVELVRHETVVETHESKPNDSRTGETGLDGNTSSAVEGGRVNDKHLERECNAKL